jgi:hypothetical protein
MPPERWARRNVKCMAKSPIPNDENDDVNYARETDIA